MALIKWDDRLKVNVATFDNQHKKLVDLTNELHTAMAQGKGKEVMGRIINELLNYTETHFKTEERYFDLYNYPGAHEQKKEHAYFVEKVAEFRDQYQKGQIGMTVGVMDFLSKWLVNHIMGTDKKYSSFFKEKGLK